MAEALEPAGMDEGILLLVVPFDSADESPEFLMGEMRLYPDRAIYGFTPSQHASGRVVDQVHVVEAGGEPHAPAFARAGIRTHAPARAAVRCSRGIRLP